jgi:hypothetical protein
MLGLSVPRLIDLGVDPHMTILATKGLTSSRYVRSSRWHCCDLCVCCCRRRCWCCCCCCRYYIAEGVRLYAQETWRRVMGDSGRANVAKYIDQVRIVQTRLGAWSCAAAFEQQH